MVRPRIRAVDRWFWVTLRRLWSRWTEVERWIGSVRRELLEHVVVLGERHLERLLAEYVAYYHDDRTHLGLAKQTPARRQPLTASDDGARLIAHPRVGGLHHRYERAA